MLLPVAQVPDAGGPLDDEDRAVVAGVALRRARRRRRTPRSVSVAAGALASRTDWLSQPDQRASRSTLCATVGQHERWFIADDLVEMSCSASASPCAQLPARIGPCRSACSSGLEAQMPGRAGALEHHARHRSRRSSRPGSRRGTRRAGWSTQYAKPPIADVRALGMLGPVSRWPPRPRPHSRDNMVAIARMARHPVCSPESVARYGDARDCGVQCLPGEHPEPRPRCLGARADPASGPTRCASSPASSSRSGGASGAGSPAAAPRARSSTSRCSRCRSAWSAGGSTT